MPCPLAGMVCHRSRIPQKSDASGCTGLLPGSDTCRFRAYCDINAGVLSLWHGRPCHTVACSGPALLTRIIHHFVWKVHLKVRKRPQRKGGPATHPAFIELLHQLCSHSRPAFYLPDACRWYGGCLTLPDGRVYVTGGDEDGPGYPRALGADIWDPAHKSYVGR